MYTKSKNSLLFVIFILIILLIVTILIISVYNTKQNTLEQYKVSLNNVLYDDEYNFISLEDDAVLKKEWDSNFYLHASKNVKYSLGTEAILYDKSKRQISIYGKVYQVFSNGDVVESDDKTTISKVDDFQFFKLNDRKYLIIGNKITGPSISTNDYLMVSIDKAGNASLLNHSVNIKTINPLDLYIGDRKFDVANEKLIVGENSIDLKKINGSTNEYVEGGNKHNASLPGQTTNSNGTSNSSGSGIINSIEELLNSSDFSNSGSSGGTVISNKVYKDIVNQIITLSGMIPSSTNKTSLYKNISLRDVSIGASYIDVYYSIVDPENKYRNAFLVVQDADDLYFEANDSEEFVVDCDSVKCINLNKDDSTQRVLGLTPGQEYVVSLHYLEGEKSVSQVADVVNVVTQVNPTLVRIVQKDAHTYTYNVKLYNEYAFNYADVLLTDCTDSETSVLDRQVLDIQNALTSAGATGELTRTSFGDSKVEFLCLKLDNVRTAQNESINVDSYHKIKVLY